MKDEEMAEEIAKDIYIHHFDDDVNYPCVLQAITVGVQKGIEIGYNKTNEWHYPSKGEYPKECENVWCYCKGIGIKFCCVGHTIVGGDNKVRWWANNKTEELRVIAWKEIVFPKGCE